MADYRKVYVRIWRDKDFEKYTTSGKFVFLYLITNPYIGESGLFEITPKAINQDTGIDVGKVESILGQLKNVFYDAPTSTVFVVKYRLYNEGGRPDLIVKAIRKERLRIASPLWGEFDRFYELTDKSIIFRGDVNGLSIDVQGFNNPTPNNNPNPNNKTNNTTANEILSEGTAQPLTDKLLRVLDTFNETRKTGRVSESILVAEVEYWLKVDNGERVFSDGELNQAADTWLKKRFYAEGKRENYFRGILRGCRNERDAKNRNIRGDTGRPDGNGPAREV